jgi:hypothetical protein
MTKGDTTTAKPHNIHPRIIIRGNIHTEFTTSTRSPDANLGRKPTEAAMVASSPHYHAGYILAEFTIGTRSPDANPGRKPTEAAMVASSPHCHAGYIRARFTKSPRSPDAIRGESQPKRQWWHPPRIIMRATSTQNLPQAPVARMIIRGGR